MVHKTATANFRKLMKAQSLIKGNCFWCVVCSQLDLPHIRIGLQNGTHEGGADSLALMIGMYQNILNKYNSVAIADCADNSHKFIALIGCQCKKRMGKTVPQSLRIGGVCAPANTCI